MQVWSTAPACGCAGHGLKATRPGDLGVGQGRHLAVAARRRYLPGAHGVPDAPNHRFVRWWFAWRRGAGPSSTGSRGDGLRGWRLGSFWAFFRLDMLRWPCVAWVIKRGWATQCPHRALGPCPREPRNFRFSLHALLHRSRAIGCYVGGRLPIRPAWWGAPHWRRCGPACK